MDAAFGRQLRCIRCNESNQFFHPAHPVHPVEKIRSGLKLLAASITRGLDGIVPLSRDDSVKTADGR
jgi:hypothetical protein